MLRYTQDTWTNDSPNVNTNLWGDDPFPAVDSNWDQPGKSLMAQLNQNIGSKGGRTRLTFSYSANKIIIDARRRRTPAERARSTPPSPRSSRSAIKQYGADRGHPVFWGGGGYGQTLWNEAPFRNNQDLFVLKDDYSAVFGKHFVKVGRPRQHQQEERGLERQRLRRELGVLGLDRPERLGRHHRQHPGRLPAQAT